MANPRTKDVLGEAEQPGWSELIERRAKEILDDGITGPECEPFLRDLVERLKRGR